MNCGACQDDASNVTPLTEDSFSEANSTNPDGSAINPKALKGLNIPAGSKLLDCPHYTRPRVWDGMEVPEILMSGNHDAVARWRLEQRIARTKQRRPDLLTSESQIDLDSESNHCEDD